MNCILITNMTSNIAKFAMIFCSQENMK